MKSIYSELSITFSFPIARRPIYFLHIYYVIAHKAIRFIRILYAGVTKMHSKSFQSHSRHIPQKPHIFLLHHSALNMSFFRATCIRFVVFFNLAQNQSSKWIIAACKLRSALVLYAYLCHNLICIIHFRLQVLTMQTSRANKSPSALVIHSPLTKP